MEDIKKLIENNQFIRVDKDGQHIEKIEEYASKDINDVLKGLNRHPKNLIALYEKTQNQKFLNDIAMAYVCEYFYGKYKDSVNNDDLKEEYDKKFKQQDEAYETLRKKYVELEKLNESYQSDIKANDLEYDKLNEKYNESLKEIEKLNKSIEDQKYSTEAEIHEYEDKITELQEIINKQSKNNQKTSNHIDSLLNIFNDLNKIVDDFSGVINELGSHNHISKNVSNTTQPGNQHRFLSNNVSLI